MPKCVECLEEVDRVDAEGVCDECFEEEAAREAYDADLFEQSLQAELEEDDDC